MIMLIFTRILCSFNWPYQVINSKLGVVGLKQMDSSFSASFRMALIYRCFQERLPTAYLIADDITTNSQNFDTGTTMVEKMAKKKRLQQR